MRSVLVRDQRLSSGLTAILVTLDGQEGMTLPELAKVLAVEAVTLRGLVRNHNLSFVHITSESQKELRKQGVIPITGRSPNFLPRETVEALVKLVNTPQAWAVYNELWVVAKAVHTGDIAQAQKSVGIFDPAVAIGHLETAIAGWKTALAEVNRLQLVVDSSKIGPKDIATLNQAITDKVDDLMAQDKWLKHPDKTASVIKRAVKAKFGPGFAASTFKEIAVTEFPAALSFVQNLTVTQFHVARKGRNTDAGMSYLRERL